MSRVSLFEEIDMPFWQDPQCHVLLTHCRDRVAIYFFCWTAPAEEDELQIGVIEIDGVAAIQHERGQAVADLPEAEFKSSIMRARHLDGETPLYRYVVHSHDAPISIIGRQHRFMQVPREQHGDVVRRLRA